MKSYPVFPLLSIHTKSDFGHTMTTEEKMLSIRKVSCFPETINKIKRREITMSAKNNNQLNIPQAREAMDKFKMQAASEVGVNLTNGYNGHLTSREAGSVGGQMVKKICPIRTTKFDRHSRISVGHVQTVQYIAAINI